MVVANGKLQVEFIEFANVFVVEVRTKRRVRDVVQIFGLSNEVVSDRDEERLEKEHYYWRVTKGCQESLSWAWKV